jgi:hypothetical protein
MPINFNYDGTWGAQSAPQIDRMLLWDRYGCFTYVTVDMFFKGVLDKLPPNYNNVELYIMVNEFMKEWKHLYCGYN